MKPKYIDEKFKPYFIFGTSEGGRVDLSDGTKDVCSVARHEAEVLIEDRDDVIKLLHLINEKYPIEFTECFNAKIIKDK